MTNFLDMPVMYEYIMGMSSKRSQLLAKRGRLISRLASLGPWVQGSVVSTSRRCGKKSCACHHGGAKHPVLFVTWKQKGKTVSLYVPRTMEPEVRNWAENHKKLKILLGKIDEVSKEIIRLREN